MKHGIILAGGHGTRMKLSTGPFKPKSMVEINGCPILYKGITYLINQGVENIHILLNRSDLKKISDAVNHIFKNFPVQFHFISEDEQRGPAYAMFLSVKKLKKGSVLILLGDTLISDRVPVDEDWVGVVEMDKRENRWCWIESENEYIKNYHDKKLPPKHIVHIACGIYCFSDVLRLKEACHDVIHGTKKKINNELQISFVLKKYGETYPLKIREIINWKDVGTTENYNKTNQTITGSNYFNKLQVDEIGRITKSSNKKYFKKEIDWISNLSEKQKLLIPRIYSIKKKSYSLEFLDIPTLSQVYYFDLLEEKFFVELFQSLLQFLEKYLWAQPQKKVDIDSMNSSCYSMFISKTRKRVEKWKKISGFHSKKSIVINGIQHLSIDELISEKLLPRLEEVIENHQWKFIHGDLNFTNILYSRKNGHYRLIDPRGGFGNLSSHYGGDLRYELAKLRHSYNGNYEMFSNGIYHIEKHSDMTYSFQKPEVSASMIKQLDNLLEERFCINIMEIKIIECALFFSMLPLHHKQEENRDLAILFRGIELLDNIHI